MEGTHLSQSSLKFQENSKSFWKKGKKDSILKRFGTTVEAPISAETLNVLGFFMWVNLRQSHCAKTYELILTSGKIYGLHNRLKDPDGINCYELLCKKICDPAVCIFPISKNGELWTLWRITSECTNTHQNLSLCHHTHQVEIFFPLCCLPPEHRHFSIFACFLFIPHIQVALL